MSSTRSGAEWRSYFMVPIAAALGYSTSVIHIYGLGPYIEPVQEAFGWSRAQVTLGLTITTFINGVFCVPIGALVDRLGPRAVGLIGVLLTCAAFALIGTATGGDGNWYLLWCAMAAATLPVQATIWTSAVASRFAASRGLALAVTLCGASVGASIFPLLATWLIGAHGWRTALLAEGAIWAAITFPMLLLFFRGAQDARRSQRAIEQAAAPALSGVSVREGLRSLVFLRLFIASALFTFTLIALVVHFVPILKDRGADAMTAAGIASLVGVFSIAGRLGTRHFGLKNFGTLYGGLLTALSLGTAFGPLVAAAMYDARGSYELFLWLTVLSMAGSALALATLPRSPVHFETRSEPPAALDAVAAAVEETA